MPIRILMKSILPAILVLTLSCVLPSVPKIAANPPFSYPEDSGVIDITRPPYLAVGDGKTDNTEAINRALRENNAHRMGRFFAPTLYFPPGKYLVSDTLLPRNPENPRQTACSVRILGAGSELTTILLRDNAQGFGDAQKPKAVLQTGNDYILGSGQPNSGYANFIQHLTVDVGSGNPGAIGIRYDVANFGAMEHVRIVSSGPDRAGRSGLSFVSVCGVGYVKDVAVEGFNYGIHFDQTAVNNLVLEHIDVRHQRIAGVHNAGKNVQLRGFKSVNTVPAVEMIHPWAVTVLVDAELDSPIQTNAPAIRLDKLGYLLARNIRTKGYTTSIASPNGNLTDASIELWLSHAPVRHSTGKMLNLPIEDAPEYHPTDFSQWANVVSFGATPNDDSDDDGPAIQAAIDSGKEVIYFPMGTYTLSSRLEVRGKVRKMDGLFSTLERGRGAANGEIVIGDLDGPFFIIENFKTRRVATIHNSNKPVVIRHRAWEGKIRCGADAKGNLFLENLGPHTDVSVSGNIKVWMRSINRETTGILNEGATLWLLGDNVERMYEKGRDKIFVNPIKTIRGKTEILGGAIDALVYPHSQDLGPLIESVDAQVSVTYAGETRIDRQTGKWGSWDLHIADRRDNETLKVTESDTLEISQPGPNQKRSVLSLYSNVE